MSALVESDVAQTGTRLVRHIAALKQLHKAGLTPSFGDVDQLFELGDELGRALMELPAVAPAQRCSRGRCTNHAEELIGNLLYCPTCAATVRRLLRDLDAFGIHPVSAPWPHSAAPAAEGGR